MPTTDVLDAGPRASIDRDVLEREYAQLTIKSVDNEQRTFRGVATSRTPDRIGDIVEPHGASFRNPLSLLLYHDGRLPVGTVTLAAPTDEGIEYEAHIPDVPEPGTLRDRLQEAWHSIKHKIIRGVSIGFRPADGGIEMLREGGYRFTKYEIVELSLVSIPANVDATVDRIRSIAKSLDRPQPAATGGRSLSGVSERARGVATTPPRSAMKTNQDRIRDLEATRETKMSDLNALQDKVTNEGRTKDPAERETFNELNDDIKAIDDEIVDLRSIEALTLERATVVRGATRVEGTQTRGGDANGNGNANAQGNGNGRSAIHYARDPELPPGIAFARYVICSVLANRHHLSIVDVAKGRYPEHTALHRFVLRAAVPAATTTDQAWAGALVPDGIVTDFVGWLRPQTIVGKFGTNGIPALQEAAFNSKVKAQTSKGSAYWVGQGKPKPLTKWTYAAQLISPTKIATIAVIAEELARLSAPQAETQVRNELRDAVVERMDVDFIDPETAAVAGVNPASITNGVAPIASTGDPRADMEALLAAFIAGNVDPTNVVLIMPNTSALSLGLRVNPLGQRVFPDIEARGGQILGMPTITSQYAAQTGHGNTVIAVNATDIYLADDGSVTIDASREASLEMSDAPTNDATTGVGASLVSMFQTNSIAIRAERMIHWLKRQPGAVAWMEHVDWSTSGSP